jgi:hypothetical protein
MANGKFTAFRRIFHGYAKQMEEVFSGVWNLVEDNSRLAWKLQHGFWLVALCMYKNDLMTCLNIICVFCVSLSQIHTQ